METFKTTLYICGCGYKTMHCGNANKHNKKVSCGHEMTHKMTEFVLKSEQIININNDDKDKYMQIISTQEDIIEKLRNKIATLNISLSKMAEKIRRKFMNMTKTAYIIEDELDDVIDDGIVYFVIEKDMEDRGKIGRTVNTDIKKLKSRYSVFGNPAIMCYFSSNIKDDENTLKKLLREAGCMGTSTEMISNISLAKQIFYDFMTSQLSNM